ncbi:ComEA family DNA-binding protein [Bifidobacterium scaligerum]|uniref:Competence protein ComEA n=1 Tax=Bifidobacterium scaligerum TaxID=2052656 RepID=A0A2M9HTE7_9BIFI|nr:helix-hairpin-helix domain-containing protein [Bifidobacterium scaligerum]PJM80086.1 competence protein ComEA [Bifidobacterium scaligerum]
MIDPQRSIRPEQDAKSAFSGRQSLSALIGVRPADTVDETARRNRDKPRLTFAINHALVVILLLVASLGVSLTLLAQQAMNLSVLSSDGNTVQASGENDDGNDSSDNNDDGDDNSVAAERHDDVQNGDADQTGQTLDEDATPAQQDGRIDLNTATSEQLQTIKGIGPVTAERILEHRKAIGRFGSVDQLLDVKGIGSKTLEKIRGQVTVR